MTDDVESIPPTDQPGGPPVEEPAPTWASSAPPWTPRSEPASAAPTQPAWWTNPAEPDPSPTEPVAWTPPAAPTEPVAWTPPAAPTEPAGWSAPGAATGSWPPPDPAGGWPPLASPSAWPQPGAPSVGTNPWSSGSAGGGWPPPPASWSPPPNDPWGRTPGTPWPATPQRRTGLAGLAAIMVAMVAAGFFGVGIGRAINRTRTVTTSASPAPAQAAGGLPDTGTGSPAGPLSGASVTAVERGIVDINTKLGYQSASAAGTGMVLTANGEVLTNNHVIDGATTITATVVATGKTYPAKVVGTDVTNDVAVLQLDGASGLTTIPLGDSSSVAAGDSVIALGNAGGIGGAPSVVTGTVQAIGQAITASDQGGANAERLTNLIETDAPIQPGDSGGPLVNAGGKVIGMDTAASTGGRFQVAANTAFAIPINDAVSIVHEIEAGKESATIHLGLPGFLGVEVQASSATGGSTSSGAVISGVVSGSPAARAGIQVGDVITGVDGHQIATASDLTTQLRSHHPNDRVAVTWADQSGASHTATVTLITGPAS